MSPFGKLLFDTAKACEGRSCEVLDQVLTAKVRAWADQQDRQSAEQDSLSTYDARRSVVEPLESTDLCGLPGFPIGLRADAQVAPSQEI